ncbi:MAG: o-succinylbenzoate--CoA ligase [Chlorobium sp.]|nr:o-succinylbenzoate--CoA ligase [Chlorobium sp.]
MDLVAAAAKTFSDSPALVTEKEILSFHDLETTTTRIAHTLSQHGIRKGDVVALCMSNSPELLLLLLALLKTEAVSAPLNHRFPAPRLQDLLPRLNPSLLIGPKTLTGTLSFPAKLTPEEILAEIDTEIPVPRQFNSSTTQHFNSSTDQQLNTSTTQHFNTPLSIIHTSSSSGNPKAALHSFGNHYYSALGANENIPFGPGDCWLLSLPLFHIGGYALLIRSLLGGGALAVAEAGTPIRDALHDFQLSHLSLVPTQLYRMLHEDETLKKLQRLKAVLLGGSAVEPALLTEASEAGLPVYLTYGSTEMSSQIATTPGPTSTITAGKVLPYRKLAIGSGNEILVKGPCLFQGYLSGKGPVLDTDASGWYHTGDTGILSPDGELQVTGRMDNMFISGGENIHPEEIERALCSLTGILRAIVVPATDPEYGIRPKAYIETAENAPQDQNITDSLSREIGKLKTPVAITRIDAWRLLPGTEKIDRGYYKGLDNRST